MYICITLCKHDIQSVNFLFSLARYGQMRQKERESEAHNINMRPYKQMYLSIFAVCTHIVHCCNAKKQQNLKMQSQKHTPKYFSLSVFVRFGSVRFGLYKFVARILTLAPLPYRSFFLGVTPKHTNNMRCMSDCNRKSEFKHINIFFLCKRIKY